MYGKLLLKHLPDKEEALSAKLPLSISASHESDKYQQTLSGIMKALQQIKCICSLFQKEILKIKAAIPSQCNYITYTIT